MRTPRVPTANARARPKISRPLFAAKQNPPPAAGLVSGGLACCSFHPARYIYRPSPLLLASTASPSGQRPRRQQVARIPGGPRLDHPPTPRSTIASACHLTPGLSPAGTLAVHADRRPPHITVCRFDPKPINAPPPRPSPPISSSGSRPREVPSHAVAMNRDRANSPEYPTSSASMEALLEPKLEDEAALPLSSPGPLVPLDQLMPGPGLDPPRPLEALLQGPQLPPFLSKTYDLVSEPALDGVISWGAAGNSIVVWDPSTFARDVLPYHFKHNNFSTFVRQLNTYGFRKVHADRWEFAHEDFMRDSKHLLKRIVRRRSSSTQQSSIQPVSSSGESSLDPEHTLRREKTALLQEVTRLKQEHRQTIEHMSTLNQRLESADDRQKQMISFLAKLLQNPTFVRQLKLQREQKEIDSTRVKRKYLKHVPHGSIESGESSSLHTGESGSHFLSSSLMAVQGDMADLQNFLLEEDDLIFGKNAENIGLEGFEAPEDIGALVQGFNTQDELGSGAELLKTPPASSPLGQDPTIGMHKGKNVLCPGLDATSSEAACLASLGENMGLLSGTMLEPAANDEQLWGIDTSAALQSSCSGSSQQAYSSLASDPYLMEIVNKPEKFWDPDFQPLDEGDLPLDKCAIDDPTLQYQKQQ